MTILYLITIAVAFLVFRETVKLHSGAFQGVELRDIVNILLLLVVPVFNLVFTVLLYIALTRNTNDDFESILKKLFILNKSK